MATELHAEDVRALLAHAKSSGALREKKEYEPDHLQPVHMQMIALRAAGLGVAEIARIVDYTPARVSVILESPEAQLLRDELTSKFVSELTQDTAELIRAHTLEAFHNHVAIMRSTQQSKPNVSLQASRDILYMGGFKPVERIINETLHLRAEDAQAIVAALHEKDQASPALEDVEMTHLAFNQTSGARPEEMLMPPHRGAAVQQDEEAQDDGQLTPARRGTTP